MMLNLAWAVGEVVGAPAAANASQATTDAVPLLALSAIMVLTLRPVLRTRLTAGTAPDRRGRPRRRGPAVDGSRRVAGPRSAARRHPVSAGGAFPALMAPIAIGPVELGNRVVSTSHQTSLVHDHLPTDDLIAYHEARARGGVGAIFIEATATDPHGAAHRTHDRRFPARGGPAYRRLADAVHAHGTQAVSPVPPRRPGADLGVAARADRALGDPQPALQDRAARAHPRGDSPADRGYATSTRHAAEGGLDGVELSISHGYLPAQFLSRQSNRRGDGWDGALNARCASRARCSPPCAPRRPRWPWAPACQRTSSLPAV